MVHCNDAVFAQSFMVQYLSSLSRNLNLKIGKPIVSAISAPKVFNIFLQLYRWLNVDLQPATVTGLSTKAI